jgi:hypothetical protein
VPGSFFCRAERGMEGFIVGPQGKSLPRHVCRRADPNRRASVIFPGEHIKSDALWGSHALRSDPPKLSRLVGGNVREARKSDLSGCHEDL